MRAVLSISLFFLVLWACQDDPFETVPSKGNLEFSKDTVYLDTVFTNIGSSTRTFKVYNRGGENISISSIRLERGEASFYRLNVDGNPGKAFENVEILSNDSIYVFVEATIDYDAVSDPLYTDRILFEGSESDQQVQLITLVQDAHFLYPARDAQGVKETIPVGRDAEGQEIRVEGFYLDGDQVWNDEKPYVIYGYAAVAEGNSLEIREGTKIYFHQGSGLLIEKNAALEIKGSLDKKVSFSGDRLEEFFEDVPGQWGTIWLKPGSLVKEISHAKIRNNTIGILIDSVGNESDAGLKMSNVEIYNTSSFGVLSRTSRIQGSNLVVGNNGESSLACLGGGDYEFIHGTFANYWSSGLRQLPTVWFSNAAGASGQEELDSRDVVLRIGNCIIEGNRSVEFILEADPGTTFEFMFSNSLLRFNDPSGVYQGDPLYDFDNQDLYFGNVFNGVTDFKDPVLHDLRIGQESDAIGIGSLEEAQRIPLDILGTERTNSPDAGAYQHQVFEEE